MESYNPEKTYSVLLLLSLLLFLSNILIQGPIVFTYNDNYGILFKMGWVHWAGYITSILLVFYHYVRFGNLNSKYVFLTLSLLVLYLIGTPIFYETLPRFEDTWSHSFLAQKMYETGKVKSTGLRYETYPGSFLFYGLLFNFLPNFYVMKFLPILLYILSAVIIFLTFKGMINAKTAFLIVIFYMLFNWTVEDNHISPQFLMLNLYFLFMFATIKIFDRTKKKKEYGFVIILLSLAIVFSHVFTPVFIALILMFTFVLCKNLRKLALPILVLVIVLLLVHETYLATTLKSLIVYMKGLKDIFSIGSMYKNAIYRFAGAESLSRQVFLGSRLTILALSVTLGAMGIRALSKKKYKTGARFIFAWSFSLIPFLILMFLVLKGEFAERFALVSSLPLSVASAYFFTHQKSKLLILIFLLVLSPLYFVSKYGNEAFESESLEKLKVDCFVSFFDSNCDEDFIVIDSPLHYDIENLGETHFAVSREEIMSARIYNSYEIDGNVFDFIDKIENERKLNRIYSTNEAWSYISG